ncbi:nitrous oxide-stimulated promoter family protein [Paenibacillus massiliensis]|uniref:nitrous oxide-stimulated promoter family protein n=1 Tax=Paenibacillus massiliensis TaxID=225917 RepID=UPI0009D9BE5D|nr:nitrous oxide-stimulated promoter family protein [Paenibacillus massiliensis]
MDNGNNRIASEKYIVEKMIIVFCRGHRHSSNHSSLCPECNELLSYAHKRLDQCRFGESKSFCEQCPIHCYSRQMRARIKEVMRYSGPRMLLYHPGLALKHMASSTLYRLRQRMST